MDPIRAGAGTAPIVDARPVPRGLLPRGIQTWVMAGLAIGIVLLVLVTGGPTAPAPTAPTTAPAALTPDRVLAYQEQLRTVEAQAARAAQIADVAPPPIGPPPPLPVMAPAPDATVTERRRRDEESLFASSVVVSRRRDDTPETVSAGTARRASPPSNGLTDPSLEAMVGALLRPRGPDAEEPSATVPPPSLPVVAVAPTPPVPDGPDPAAAAAPPSGDEPRHPVVEGTLLDTVLVHRLDGSVAAPITCLVTTPVFSRNRRHLLIPAGAQLLGRTTPVKATGETRLAVTFHRLVFPDGQTVPLDAPLGLNQAGDAGLRDQVDAHTWSAFGAASAVGLISGFAQWLTTGGVRAPGDQTVVLAGASDAPAEATVQILNRSLNRLPTITIREGHRVKVYVTRDLALPTYHPAQEED